MNHFLYKIKMGKAVRRTRMLAVLFLALLTAGVVLAASELVPVRTIEIVDDFTVSKKIPHGLRWITSFVSGGADKVSWFVDSSENSLTSLDTEGQLNRETLQYNGVPEGSQDLRQVRKGGEKHAFQTLDKASESHRFFLAGQSIEGALDQGLSQVELQEGIGKTVLIVDYQFSDDWIVALGDFEVTSPTAVGAFPTTGWFTSLVKIAVDTGEVVPLITDFETLLQGPDSVEGTEPNATFMDYALDTSMRYIAVDWSEKKVYTLLLRSPVRIVEIDLEQTEGTEGENTRILANLPPALSDFPSFSSIPEYWRFNPGLDRFAKWLRIKERADMPLGLFSNGNGGLFLLGKSASYGATQFALSQIDPNRGGTEVSRHSLPFAEGTEHVIAAAPQGRNEGWSFLTQGELTTLGESYSLPSLEFLSFPLSLVE